MKIQRHRQGSSSASLNFGERYIEGYVRTDDGIVLVDSWLESKKYRTLYTMNLGGECFMGSEVSKRRTKRGYQLMAVKFAKAVVKIAAEENKNENEN